MKIINKELKDRLAKEIEEIRDPLMFSGIHAGKEHVFSRHLEISLNQMRRRIERMPFAKDGFVIVSRFDQKLDRFKIIQMICDCLSDEYNLNLLIDWLESDKERTEIELDFSHPIGEGFIKGTDYSEPMKLSSIRVILTKPYSKELFNIITAYPSPGFNEIDDVWDAIDDWAKKNTGRRK